MASLDKSDGPPCDDLLWNDNGELYYIGRRIYRARDDQACRRCDRRWGREVAALKRNACVTHLCNVSSVSKLFGYYVTALLRQPSQSAACAGAECSPTK
jgi:hypothetical protein